MEIIKELHVSGRMFYIVMRGNDVLCNVVGGCAVLLAEREDAEAIINILNHPQVRPCYTWRERK